MSTKDLSGFSNDSSAEESHAGNYFRGFYDAEKRRKIINHDPTVGQAIAGAALGAIPFALIAYFIMRRRTAKAVAAASGAPAQSGFMQQMQSTMEKMMNPAGNRDFRVEVKDTTFKDVLGIPEALEEVQQYVRFLRTPEEFTRLGGRLPRGCLLSGDPGTGKTLLARAVAGEAGVPFFSCSGADFIEVYAGSGPKRVRELFAAAKKECPSVIFIDEIDAVGSRSSGSDNSGLHGEENRTINQLLAELDGLNAGDPVIVFAATNFRDNLDRALLREGRFDRKVEIPMPDRAARAELFTHYLGKVVSEDPATQATALAELTPGVSPATIAAVVNEAALSAAIQDKPAVSLKDLLPAIDDVLIGKKHRNRMSVQAAQRTALHEAGHTLIASLLPEQSAVIKASITPRGPAAGFTQQVGRETLDMPTEFSLFTDICVMLGGRLAELTQHDNLTTGAQDDYQRATKTALRSFLSFGLSSQVGLLSVEPQRLDEGRMHQRHSEEAQKVAEAEAALLVGAATQLVRQLLTQHQATLKRIADELFDKKELLREDLQRIMDLERLSKDSISAEVRSALTRYTAKSEELALQRTARRESMTMATN